VKQPQGGGNNNLKIKMNVGMRMTVVCVPVVGSVENQMIKGGQNWGDFVVSGVFLGKNLFTYLTPNLAATRFHCDKPLNLRAATLWTSRNGFFEFAK
jgi:hypothetical protein